jgi:Flp pilus assembly protein TadB
LDLPQASSPARARFSVRNALKDLLMKAGYLKRRGWTRLEVAICLFALAFVILCGILLVTQVVGHWVLFVGPVIVLSLGLMRYRSEAERTKRNADDYAE